LAVDFVRPEAGSRLVPTMKLRTEEESPNEVTSKVLAWLAYAALGLAALLNTVIAGTILVGGHLIGVVSDVAAKSEGGAELASDAGHAALVAKLIAIGFGILAATEYAAGHFLKRRVRTMFVPIALALTILGEVGFSVWTKHFNALDAVIIGCALFAGFVWYRLPRPEALDAALATS
jgi:hypothetical protein